MSIELNILQKWINESDNIVFLSGKDFSKEAGYPDYREMDEDFLKTYKYTPDQMLCLTFLQRYPMFFYRYYRAKILAPLFEAQPTAAHEILAKLEECGRLKAILTVNIDGIHQEAGSRNVLELRGSAMRNWCAKCDRFLDFSYIADSPTPIAYCTVDMCGDFVRPAIVLKEEPYDWDLIQRAMDCVRACDTLLIDGSAMGEFPVPNLMQAYQGHKLILFNTAPGIFDSRAGLVIRSQGTFDEIFSKLDLDFTPREAAAQSVPHPQPNPNDTDAAGG